MSLRRPNVVVFDVIETMLSLEPVRAALEPLGVSVELFLTRLLRDGFALSLAETYRPFRDVASAAVEALAQDASREQVDRVLAAFQQLRPYSDVEPALERLAAADVSVVTLTNGDQQATTSLLEANGLDRYIHRVLTIQDAQRWKPSPTPYQHAVVNLGRRPSEVALVAVHAWDIHGAHNAGLVTGWCERLEGRYPSIFDPPDVTGDDLVAVADALLALPLPTRSSA